MQGKLYHKLKKFRSQNAPHSSLKLLVKLGFIPAAQNKPSPECMTTPVYCGSVQKKPAMPLNATYELSLCRKGFTQVISAASFLYQFEVSKIN